MKTWITTRGTYRRVSLVLIQYYVKNFLNTYMKGNHTKSQLCIHRKRSLLRGNYRRFDFGNIHPRFWTCLRVLSSKAFKKQRQSQQQNPQSLLHSKLYYKRQ